MKEANDARRSPTSYTIGKSSARDGDIFREYLLPDGGRAKMLDEDIFNEALRRGSRALEQINAKQNRPPKVLRLGFARRPGGSKDDE